MTSALTTRPEAVPRLRGGWRIVGRKEVADHLHSLRFVILVVLVALAGLAAVHSASGPLREAAAEATESPSVFLLLFRLSPERVPAFHELIGILGPLLGIAFGFDAINGERAQGTLARLLSHPIYRDDLINGKFAAGLAAIAFAVVGITLLVAGIGIVRLGIVPSVGEVARLATWVAVTIIYVGLWLSIATLCSVIVPRAATSALIAIGLWLFFSLFGALLAQLLAGILDPSSGQAGAEAALDRARLEQTLGFINPGTAYAQATLGILNPGVTSVSVPGLAQAIQLSQQIPTQLSLQQSLLIVWPQVVAMLAAMVVCFVLSYIAFLRQEVRA